MTFCALWLHVQDPVLFPDGLLWCLCVVCGVFCLSCHWCSLHSPAKTGPGSCQEVCPWSSVGQGGEEEETGGGRGSPSQQAASHQLVMNHTHLLVSHSFTTYIHDHIYHYCQSVYMYTLYSCLHKLLMSFVSCFIYILNQRGAVQTMHNMQAQ